MMGQIESGSGSIGSVFDNLSDLRDSLRGIAEGRSDIQKIKSSMQNGTVGEALKKLQNIEKSLDKFNDISDEMNSSLDHLDNLDYADKSTYETNATPGAKSWEKYLD
jgi:hypothetical protein